jgi:phage terminase large subunit-like protein
MAAPWSLAVPDWEERIRAGRSLLPALPLLDQAEAARAIGIFNKLRLPDVIGTPTLAEAGGDWFREIVGAVLGSVDPATSKRMIRELFLLAPKKSSKTSYGAAFMVTALLMNERPRAEFLLIAPTISTATIAFNQAVGMVLADPFLVKRFHLREHLRRITDRRTKASLEIKSFETNVLTGVKPAGVLLDELHEIAKNPAAERIIGQIRGGMLPNPEAFMAMITTQSDQPPRGAFLSELMMARNVRDGRSKSSMLSVLYEFPPDIALDKKIPPAWEDPANWAMVTPNLGRPFGLDDLVDDFGKAKEKGAREVIRWASQHLNIEIGLALGSDRWAGADHWEVRADKSISVAEIIRRCDLIVVGLDGGGLDDLLGMAVLGREIATGNFLLWNRAWAHSMVLDRRQSEASRMRDFEKDGDLVIVDAMEDAFEEMAGIIESVKDSNKLGGVAVDPYGVKHINTALDSIGIAESVGVPQGWKLSGAIKDVEIGLSDGTLEHAGQRLMAWCVGNAKVEAKGNAVTITKQAAGTAKIDPLVATFIAESLLATNPRPLGVVDIAAMIA